MTDKKWPFISQIVPINNTAMVITCVDLQKMEGTYRLFPNWEEAEAWVHHASYVQFPDWHDEHCYHCVKKTEDGGAK